MIVNKTDEKDLVLTDTSITLGGKNLSVEEFDISDVWTISSSTWITAMDGKVRVIDGVLALIDINVSYNYSSTSKQRYVTPGLEFNNTWKYIFDRTCLYNMSGSTIGPSDEGTLSHVGGSHTNGIPFICNIPIYGEEMTSSTVSVLLTDYNGFPSTGTAVFSVVIPVKVRGA